jgi:crossover junction endodeoxyribonuclease RuvC
MAHTRKNPVAGEAADRASKTFILAAERAEDSRTLAELQDRSLPDHSIATQLLLGDVSAAAMDAVVVGIDPGGHGAISGHDESGGLLWVVDMPSTTEANGRIATNAPLLAGILARSHARVAFCEFVGARPTDARVAAFAFGRARGCIEGVCGALSIPIVFIAPPVWKRLAAIPPGAENKDLARTRAIARWPAHAELFARKKDVDKAEACLIAIAGLMRGRANG